MLSLLPSIIVLGLAMLLAIRMCRLRHSPSENVSERVTASYALALSTGIQSIHFVEEAATGFHERFPALFGLPNISFSIFVVFNVTWIAIWIASVPGLRAARTAAFFAAWFLAIAGILNGIGHPLLAFAVDGYFPGLITSPFIALTSVWLWFTLRRATRPTIIQDGSLASE